MSMREVVKAYKNVVWYSDKEKQKTTFCLKNLTFVEFCHDASKEKCIFL